MTCNEMLQEFNLAYNNISSNQAPGLLVYEISRYLTMAQEIIVHQLYSRYEQDELARKQLSELVTAIRITDPVAVPSSYKIHGASVTYQLPDDIMYIVHEELKMKSSANKCIKDKFIEVLPVTHDDFNSVYKNPYKFTLKRALRLDISYNNIKCSEIVSKDNHIEYYQLRYIRRPRPIILDNLGFGDTINGQNTQSSCELNDLLSREIVNLGAKLAYQDFKA